MTAAKAHDRRVRRLLAWYPPAWRARYGAEFAELLAADLADRPRCWRRSADVARAGLRARLAGAGLAGHPLDPAAAAMAGVTTLGACLMVAGTFGAAMWSELAIGVQWTVPNDQGITQALDLMSLALLVLAVLAVLAAVPVIAAAVGAARRGSGRALARPAVVTTAGVLALVIGGRHFANGWPGTGGHLLLHQGLVPGGVAAFGWAVTLWVSSYWAHPGLLAAFGVSELIWMAATPAAIGAVAAGFIGVWRRAEPSSRVLRYVSRLARAGLASSLVFLAGSLRWLLVAGGPGGLFHAGSIDLAAAAALAVAVAVGAQASRRAGLA